ncbi:hypothetical protein QYH69_32420 [Paraburkholderia sp. SARCC-3016]|uniref:hypothetical protein n=1 Tax=Paraburkholderia sp. SARCC-3016 TaxID=3058611 RepID=UPI0028094633|nr:hypothetical protein [Paraburkholderia sp. SARCC-3016]MDQ7981930.1 hypothetical protein [Paraburkholderia sp. SARCC-3016]
MDASAAAVQQAYAAWVQAIGSVIAIGVAIYVPYRQRRQDMMLREFHYWTERADVERRIYIVALDLGKFLQRLIEESRPSAGATKICTYYPTLHEELWERVATLEARDIDDSGHDRVEAMRSVLRRLHSLYPNGSHVEVRPGSPFSRELAEGLISQDADACVTDTSERLEVARRNVLRFSTQ